MGLKAEQCLELVDFFSTRGFEPGTGDPSRWLSDQVGVSSYYLRTVKAMPTVKPRAVVVLPEKYSEQAAAFYLDQVKSLAKGKRALIFSFHEKYRRVFSGQDKRWFYMAHDDPCGYS